MIIQGKALFDISKAIPAIAKDSYFMDAQFRIFSTRATKNKLVQINGSRAKNEQYYKFAMAHHSSWSPTCKYSQLKIACSSHKDFAGDASMVVSAAEAYEAANPTPDRKFAPSINDGIRGRGWLIGQVNDKAIIFGSKPVIHMSEASVDAELTRLAAKKPGTKFVRLKIDKALTMGGIQWE